jgi:lysophospholipase L1-like esterase
MAFIKAFRNVRWSRRSAAAIVAAAAMLALAGDRALEAQGGRSGERWVGTWATAVQAPFTIQAPPQPAATPAPNTANSSGTPPRAPAPVTSFNNQTIRQIVRVSIGGERLRVTFSNVHGTEQLAIGAAHVALRARDAAIVAASGRPLTFAGRPSMIVPPGAVVVSDPVALSVPPLGDLAIDAYLPGMTPAGSSPLTLHSTALQTNYVSQAGNHAGAATLPVATTTQSWFFLSRVDVIAPEQTGAIVTFGDSITDGTASTPDTNNRWPNHLARRLMARSAGARFAVLNAGISGNRVLTDGLGVSALQRFDRDALVQPGVTHIVVLEGINDIGLAAGLFGLPRRDPPPTADDIIAGHRQLIERAHAQGLRIYGATLLPYEGARYWSPEGEKARQAVNQWIRTSKAYDAVIDFEAAVKDPQNPTKILPKFDSGDHLHPSDLGYQAMADAVDLALFATPARATSATP